MSRKDLGDQHKGERCPPLTVLPGMINTVTILVKNKKTQLVVNAHDVDPIKLVVFPPTLSLDEGSLCIVKSQVGWGIWPTERSVPPLPSHRLTREIKELWLRGWKPSGPIIMTNMMRSAITRETTSWVQNQRLTVPSWKRQRLRK